MRISGRISPAEERGADMRIYDISQEVFGCAVFPGDTQPEHIWAQRISENGICNLTVIRMCAHNGTHVDSPYHFLDHGATIDQIPLDRFIGYAYVAEFDGAIGKEDAVAILNKAGKADAYCTDPSDKASFRILVKGNAVVTEEAAKVFADAHIRLFGNESQTVGPEDAPMAVHLIMLSEGIILLEGIRLHDVPEGVYLLNAAPLNLGGADGAPCRAVLMDI